VLFFVTVLGNVLFARLLGVMVRMRRMSVSQMRMVRGAFMIPGLVMPGRFAMMARCVLVMFGRAMMVFGGWMFVAHSILSGLNAKMRSVSNSYPLPKICG
jgi:hypothetical protein